MKAIVFTKYGISNVLHYQETELPGPKEYEVLIKVRATSINDWDWGLMQGKPYIIRLFIGLRKPKINIPGVDVAGVVEAVGEKVTTFRVGDEVFGDLSESGFGAFAEYVCANESALIKKPPIMSFEQAAALPHAAMLAVQGLIDIGKIQQGQQILLNGAGGGVGTQGIQIAKLFNVESSAVDKGEKLEMLTSLGFDHVIDYHQEDFTKSNKQYNLILDVKTNRSIFKYLRALKPKGKYVTVGGDMRRVLAISLFGWLITLITGKSLQVLGLKPNKDLQYIVDLHNKGKLKPLIEGPYNLDEVPELIQYFGAGKHKGKIIIKVSE